jgi:hypothetical protein
MEDYLVQPTLSGFISCEEKCNWILAWMNQKI